MGPKLPPTAAKAQVSLMTSFFQKAPSAPKVAACTPVAPNPIKEAITSAAAMSKESTSSEEVSNGDNVKTSSVTPATLAKPATVVATKKAEASKPKRSRVVDDDDEEAEFDSSNVKPMPDSKGEFGHVRIVTSNDPL